MRLDLSRTEYKDVTDLTLLNTMITYNLYQIYKINLTFFSVSKQQNPPKGKKGEYFYFYS